MKKIFAWERDGKVDEIMNISGRWVMCDDEDYEMLMENDWEVLKGYVVTKNMKWKGKGGKGSLLAMHRLIMSMYEGIPEGSVVIHIDRDKMNNQKSNLIVRSKGHKKDDKWNMIKERIKEFNENNSKMDALE